MHSRPIPSIVHEVRRLAANGTREFNLIAQDLSCYGRDLKNGTSLAALLRELVKIEGVKWIRLFYLYPTYFDDELLHVILTEDKSANTWIFPSSTSVILCSSVCTEGILLKASEPFSISFVPLLPA